MTKVVTPNEITSALIADKCRSDDGFMQSMQANGAEALASLPGVSASDIQVDVRTVQNTVDVVHVALPHYSGLEDAVAQSREKMSDEEMAQIAGGEVGWLVFGIIATFVGTVTVATVGAGIFIQ